MNVTSATAKSSLQQLVKRGYIDDPSFHFEHQTLSQYLSMLKSDIAVERSLAARGLKVHMPDEKVAEHLLNTLQKEKALYTKIEITDTLKCGNKKTLMLMLSYLGKIGNNQYTTLPERITKKKTYPLPRDIIARTIAHMSTNHLLYLIEYLEKCTLPQARELIDAIGFLAFHNQIDRAKVFASLVIYFENSKDCILRWKLITCFSAFLPFSKDYLIGLSNDHDLLGKEAQRSLSFTNRFD